MGVRTVKTCAATLLAMSLTGCAPSRPSSDTALLLARDSAPLMALCPIEQSIDAAKWPASFAASGVESAYIGQGGLYLETGRLYVQEAGVFIPCDVSKFSSGSETGEDPMYMKVAEGVFTYYVAG
jgi:hypothetical protein